MRRLHKTIRRILPLAALAMIPACDGGVTWIEVGSWVGESFDARFERRVFFIGNGFDYMTYRLEVSKNRGDDTRMQIAEIELIGPR